MDNPFDTPPPRCEGCNPALMIFPETVQYFTECTAEEIGGILKPVFQWLEGIKPELPESAKDRWFANGIVARHIVEGGKYKEKWERNHKGGVARSEKVKRKLPDIPIEEIEKVCGKLLIDKRYATLFRDKMALQNNSIWTRNGRKCYVTALNLEHTIQAEFNKANPEELERYGIIK